MLEDDEEDEEDGRGFQVARSEFWEGGLPGKNYRVCSFSPLIVFTNGESIL
jgi:hypothetical protein